MHVQSHLQGISFYSGGGGGVHSDPIWPVGQVAPTPENYLYAYKHVLQI